MPVLRSLLFAFVAAVSASNAPAQGTTSGTIVGRILNAATGEYVRNAEVRVESTGQSAVSGDGGGFRLAQVPAGEVTLRVIYIGSAPVVATVTVPVGGTVTLDFSLRSSTENDSGTIKLGAFKVSGEREGNAKAIMEQRNSMNITNSVASETFGDVSEGNIGEFMKHLSGVEIELNADKVLAVRLRGLGAEYTSVTYDGVSLPGTDANGGAAGNARAFNFEQVGLSSIDSIEVLKTVSADQDANAPAGTINLRPKRAFDRKGRRISWQTNLSAFSEELTLHRGFGPDEHRRHKVLPGGSLDYSDVFFNNRLGLVLNVSESNVYSIWSNMSVTYNYTPTAADPRPVVPTTINPLYGPRTNEVFSTSLTADFRATPKLVLSFAAMYNKVDLWYYIRDGFFDAVNRSLVVGTDPLKSFSAGPGNGRVRTQQRGINKMGEGQSLLPKFEYKHDNLTIDGRFAYSTSKSSYNPNRFDSVNNVGTPTLNGVDFTASRSHNSSSDWAITQTAGSDWSDGRFYTAPAMVLGDGRLSKMKIYSGDVTATLHTARVLPVVWKAGVKSQREARDFSDTRPLMNYDYIGPGAGTGAWARVSSPWPMYTNMLDANLRSMSGGSHFIPNLLDVYKLYQDHPEYFASNITPANYYSARVANVRHYVEDINAAFFMGTATIGKRTTFRAGLRYEQTKGDARETDPRTPAEVRAAGHAVSAGRATTIPGLDYQYFSQPLIHRKGEYDNFFPSSSFKYRISDHLDAHVGYSRTIRRPTFRDVAGVWDINDTTLRVTAPNPNLEPEISDNLSGRLAYYFEPVGIVAANFFQNTVDGLFISSEMTPEEYGYTGDLDLTGYTIVSTVSGSNKTKIRGMEFEYSQSLSFLPRPFNGLNVRASYTRNEAEVILPQLAKHSIKGGLSFRWRGLNTYANVSWHDSYPTNAAGTTYRRHRAVTDGGASYRFSPRLELFLSLRNMFNVPLLNMQKNGANPAVVTSYQSMGTVINLGLRGNF